MKKIIASILCIAILFAFTACKKETPLVETLPLPTQNDYSEYDFPDYSNMSEFSNLAQYANMQGYCGWYYCYGSTDDEMYFMVYEPYSGSYRGESEIESYIQKDEWQPSNEFDIAACFKAPRAGKVTLSIDVALIYTQGNGDDGISFYCITSVNSEEAFWAKYLIGSNPSASEEIELTVQKGEVIYFVMSANESRWNDLSRVSLNVSYGGLL